MGYLSTSVDKPCWNKRAAGAKFCDLCTIMCDFPITKSHWGLPGSQNFPLRGLKDTTTFLSYCCFPDAHPKKPPLLVDSQNNKGFFFGWPPYQVTLRKEDNSLYYGTTAQAKKIWGIFALSRQIVLEQARRRREILRIMYDYA